MGKDKDEEPFRCKTSSDSLNKILRLTITMHIIINTLFILILLDEITLSSSFGTILKTPRKSSHLNFNMPNFGAKDDVEKEEKEEKKEKISLSGLFQLITAGAGSPFLGDF